MINWLFLAHLSWMIKWAFLITCRPSTVCPSVCKLFTFSSSSREPLGQSLVQFNQTWHNASLGEWKSNLVSRRAPPFSKGILLQNSKNTSTILKNLLLYNSWANFNLSWHKASLGEMNSSLFKWRTNKFS